MGKINLDFFFKKVVLGIKLRVLHMLERRLATTLHLQPHKFRNLKCRQWIMFSNIIVPTSPVPHMGQSSCFLEFQNKGSEFSFLKTWSLPGPWTSSGCGSTYILSCGFKILIPDLSPYLALYSGAGPILQTKLWFPASFLVPKHLFWVQLDDKKKRKEKQENVVGSARWFSRRRVRVATSDNLNWSCGIYNSRGEVTLATTFVFVGVGGWGLWCVCAHTLYKFVEGQDSGQGIQNYICYNLGSTTILHGVSFIDRISPFYLFSVLNFDTSFFLGQCYRPNYLIFSLHP